MNEATLKLIQLIHQSPIRGVFAVTGGGASTIASLLAVHGASRTVLEAIVPYAEDALTQFLGTRPEPFCSSTCAAMIARRAWERATHLTNERPVVGVGCTASLATDRPKKGDHRAFIGIHTDDGARTVSIRFVKDARKRAEEESFVEALILNELAEIAKIPQRLNVPLLSWEKVEREVVASPTGWSSLLIGAQPWLCQEPDGRLRSDGVLPAALLPGSFHPLHAGHRQLAEIAERRLKRPVAFELSITNVDKPGLEAEPLRMRMHQFVELAPLWMSRAPTFVEKAKLFPGVLFVVGADTAIRIVDAKYYGDNVSKRDEAMGFLSQQGCRFLVAGRQDPKTGQFIAGGAITIPEVARDLFEFLREDEFRIDLSSTKLRNPNAG